MGLALLVCSILAAAPSEKPLDDRGAYEAAKAQAGRDSEAQVKLALWCEAHGLKAERMKHLAIAVLNDPKNAVARGLMGLVEYQGKWQRPEVVAARAKSDESSAALIAEYNGRRARMKNTADAHWKLALWCDENGLKPEAIAHFTAVTRLEPARAAAWQRLGCTKLGSRWVSPTELAALKQERALQTRADKRWKPVLLKWRGWLENKQRRPEGEAALAGVTDPRAVPSIWAIFANNDPVRHAFAVKMLGQIDARDATEALVILAICSPSAEARREAAETLKLRDAREYVALLIALLRKPVRYEVRPVNGPGTTGILFVEGSRFNVQRLYEPPPLPNVPLNAAENLYFDQFGSPVVSLFNGSWSDDETTRQTVDQSIQTRYLKPGFRDLFGVRANNVSVARVTLNTETAHHSHTDSIYVPIGQIAAEHERSALAAREQLQNDVLLVETFNATVARRNEAVSRLLNEATGREFADDQRAWLKWWADQLGYVFKPAPEQPRPTLVQEVPLAYVPSGVSTVSMTATTTTHSTSHTIVFARWAEMGAACFKAGTSVHTLMGIRAIETLRVGDQVLAQDVKRGTLSYQPLVAVFHNPPSPTFRIEIGEETIVATGIHRFWKASKGWVMARDLKPGDTLRTIGGTARVHRIEPEAVQPVFNAEVASGQSFFVGQQGLLVHDNSSVAPATEPFDDSPTLTTRPMTK